MVDNIKQFNDKLVVFILLTAMMIVFIPSTSSKYVKEYPVDFTLSTKLAQFQLIWTDQTGSNAPEAKTISKGDIGFSSEGYYLLVAKGGNGSAAYTSSGVAFNSGYGGIIGGVFKLNPENVTFEVALGVSGDGNTAGVNALNSGGMGGASSALPSTYVGGAFAGGGATMLLVVNDYNTTSSSGPTGYEALNRLLLIAGGGGGSATYSEGQYNGGAGGSNFINATSGQSRSVLASQFEEYIGSAGVGDYAAGTAGDYSLSSDTIKSTNNRGSRLYKWLTHGQGVGYGTSYGGSCLGGGGGGGFAGGGVGTAYGGGGGGGSSAINTTSSITKVEYQSSYSAARILEIYKEKMAEMISLDTNTNSSGQRISDLCVLGSEGYLYNKSDTSIYSDISFVAIYYLGTTAP